MTESKDRSGRKGPLWCLVQLHAQSRTADQFAQAFVISGLENPEAWRQNNISDSQLHFLTFVIMIKVSPYLHPEPHMFLLLLLPLALPPDTSVKRPAVTPTSPAISAGDAARCSLLPPEQALLPQPLLTGQGLQIRTVLLAFC